MSPAQEEKLDKILIAVTEHKALIAQNKKDIDDHESSIRSLEAHKNKTVGIAAFVSLVFTTLGAALLALFKS